MRAKHRNIYNNSKLGKEAKSRYNHSEKGRSNRRENVIKYRSRDPEYHRMKARARRHGIQPDLIQQILDRDIVCQLCGIEENLTIDHIHPSSKGGLAVWKNLHVLCRSCNAFKGNRLFLPDGGMLL